MTATETKKKRQITSRSPASILGTASPFLVQRCLEAKAVLAMSAAMLWLWLCCLAMKWRVESCTN